MASPRVLVFGGNGGIGRLMADSMLTKSWHVTSVVRDPRQKADVLQLGPKRGPKADVLVVDLARMKSEDASKILTQFKPKYIVLAAGSMSNVNSFKRDAAKKIIKAAKAPWWDATDYQNILDETRAYTEIAEAKLNSDEYLVAMAKQRSDNSPGSFQAISLRSSWLTKAPSGRIHLGKNKFSGRVSRADVATVAASLLSRNDTSGWFDLVDGSEYIESAVDNAVQNNLNSIEGGILSRCIVKQDRAEPTRVGCIGS